MILTVFRSRLRFDAGDYPEVAAEMLELAQQMLGFVSFKTFKNDDGERCSIVLFADYPPALAIQRVSGPGRTSEHFC
jgi:hypothetical protein